MSKRNPERPWATGVLVLAGAISLSFNTVHSVDHTSLDAPLALLYGSGPVVLAAAQSHVVALQAARGELVDGWRRAFTFGLVIGALALSFLGIFDLLQHAVPDPIPLTSVNEPAVLTPIVVDLMAIAALAELLRPGLPAHRANQTPHIPHAEARTAPAPRTDDPHRTELLRTVPAPRRTDGPHTPVPARPHTTPRTQEAPQTFPAPHAEPPAPAGEREPASPAPHDSPHAAAARGATVTSINGAATRAEWSARIADEIRTARADGRTWEPDYDDLMARTGFKRRWCEARVQEARTEVARTDRAEAARPREPHADGDDPERADRTGTDY
ncbi:hypothetical protein E1287_34620 [Actinomadura sp. KC06]|uniref:hypothetical protein n=1 Tax=Actinomadura sp. KC06 TaxID=2530369 RepID=UPI00104F4060|nr:hypothetical protein [Actinomadura sp. KC06]TDD27353.1 hypothetical protein E1287_34620 [Actinomadura sp. KC06]